MPKDPNRKQWQGSIDGSLWHALVESSGRVVQIYRPHVQGTLKVYYRGAQQLQQLREVPTDELVDLAITGEAFVVDGILQGSTTTAALDRRVAKRCEQIDAETRAEIDRGVLIGGKTHSLSLNALANLEALLGAAAEEFPMQLSTADNLDATVVASITELLAIRDAARRRLREIIAGGEAAKAAVRLNRG